MSQPSPITNTMPTSNGGGQRSQGNVEEDLFKDDLNSGNQSTKGKNSI